MDSGGPSRPVTRGVKRTVRKEREAAEEKKKRIQSEKRTMKGFLEPRLTESATNPGTKVILIARNDILVDPVNPEKILIPDDTLVKVEVKEEQASGEVEIEEGPSTSGFRAQDESIPEHEFRGSDDPDGSDKTEVTGNEDGVEPELGYAAPSFPNPGSVKIEVNKEEEVGDSDQLAGEKDGREVNCGEGSNLGWSGIAIQNVRTETIPQGECARCRDLEKWLKETEKKLEKAPNMVVETEAEKKKQAGVGKDEDEENWKSFLRSISSEESEDIDTLVVKASKNCKNESGDTILHYFARAGNLKAVKHIVSVEGFNGDVNAKNYYGSTPIMEAIKAERNFAEIANLLVAKGADLNAIDYRGRNALFIALTSSQQPLTEIGKAFGPLTSSVCRLTDGAKQSVLHEAAQQGALKSLEYYMSLKPNPDDINAMNPDGWTPIMKSLYAPINVFSPIIDLLLKNGANFEHDHRRGGIIPTALLFKKPLSYIEKLVDVGAPWNKDFVLFTCIKFVHVEALKYFITKGADVNAKTTEGMTPLLIARIMGRSDLVDILIENGANPWQRLHMTFNTILSIKRLFKDSVCIRGRFSLKILTILSQNGVTWDNWMLHECAGAENWEAVRYCVLKGADVNSKNSYGKTPLIHVVTSKRVNPEIVDFLIAKGANVNEKDRDGFNALHYGVANFSCSPHIFLAIVRKLISNGATCSKGVIGSGPRKESILHAAVRGGNPKVVEFFISKGVDVKARDNNGDTPFLLAARQEPSSLNVLRALVNGGADPNDRDMDGSNALLIEVGKYRKSVEAVKLLVELGCDWRVPNFEGDTVLGELEREEDSKFLKCFKSLIG